MRLHLLVTMILFSTLAGAGQEHYPAVRAELLAMQKVDQDARNQCLNGPKDAELKCLAALSKTIDEPHEQRLKVIFDQIGFPDSAKVGTDAMQAFMTMLQHIPGDDLRVKSLKPITAVFKKKEMDPMQYANFVDRLRLHQGKKQLYGGSFDFKNGKLVMSPTEDLKHLDKRRAKIGLPPLSEYVKFLADMYHMDVETPK